MQPFDSLFPELAAREVRCLYIGRSTEAQPQLDLPADEYAFLEFYCEEPDCDCRRVFFQVVRKGQPDQVLASIEYGWEKESFYRNDSWGAEQARQTVRGFLDPINEQSEFAGRLLQIFQQVVLDVPYSLRLRRHYRMFKEELARRAEKSNAQPTQPKPGP